MNMDLMRCLRFFLLSLTLVAFSGCGWFDRDENEDPPSEQPEEPEEPEFPDPPVYPGGKFFGTAPDNAGDYLQLLNYFNQLTPGNAGKWGSVEAVRDVMNWTDLDTAYQFARDQEIGFKLHTLIWGQQQPAWINDLAPEEQLEEIEEWFSELAARYPDIEMIDVVNEPINAPPSYAAALGGAGATGWDWLIKAFELAREHFPGAILILNEYRVLQGPEFTQQYLVLIDLLQDRGLIDAIGEEGHFLEKTSASMVQTNLDTLAGTGLPIYITEFDLNIANDAQHANVMRDLFTVFWEHPAVQGVTHWGYRQGSMWRPDAYLLRSNGTERPGLEWLVCYLEGGDDCDVPEYVPSGWQGDAAGLTLQAEQFDEGSGVLALGEVVAYTNAGEWIRFSAVEFQNGWNKLAVRYSKGNDTELANISIHLGSLESEAVAVIDLPYTGGWGVFDTVEVDWTSLFTTEDVYIRFNDDPDAVANLDYVHFFGSGDPEPEGDNLMNNGGFESGIAGWTSWNGSTLSASTAQKHEGDQSLLATNRPNTNQFAVSPNIGGALTAGTTYPVSAWVYQAGSGADTVRMAAKIGCAGGDSYPWIHNHETVPANTWTQLSGNLEIPVGCDIVEVLIFFEGTTIGVDVYIDEIVVLGESAGGGDDNLLNNGGFESGIAGWASWNGSTLSASTAQKHEGDQSLLATNRPNTNQFAVSPNIGGALTAGTTYPVSAWVYQAGSGADTVRMAAKIGCAGGDSYPWIHNHETVPANTWTQLSGNLEIPVGCDIVEVLIFFEGTTIGVDVYIDDVKVLAP